MLPYEITHDDIEHANELYSFKHVDHACRTTNSRKVSGDSIPAIALKHLPTIAIKLLQRLFINSYLSSTVPQGWQHSSIVELFKSGDITDPSRYRPICLISICFKIFQQITYYHHFREKIFASKRQHGFQQQRSCVTQLKYALDCILKYRTEHDSVYGCAIDLSQAFDMMTHGSVYTELVKMLKTLDLNLINNIITNQQFYFRRDVHKELFRYGRGTPQGGTLSPCLFAYILDCILLEFNEDDKYSILIYADDILLLSYDKSILEELANSVIRKLQDYGFVANINKFQLFSNEPDCSIIIQNLEIKSVPFIKYLGLFIDYTGICYAEDLKLKEQKAIHSVSIIKWTRYHQSFQDAFKRFYSGCLLPVLGYGVELYDTTHLLLLEKVRIKSIKSLHFGKYRFHELHNEYLSMKLFREIKLPSLNKQLLKLNIDTIPTIEKSKKEIYQLNTERVQHNWNNQPKIFRASTFKVEDMIMKMALDKKLPNHQRKLLHGFLTGYLPYKSSKKQMAICTECHEDFENLDHFSGPCEEIYWPRSQIYADLKSNSKNHIINTLKNIKQSVSRVTVA